MRYVWVCVGLAAVVSVGLLISGAATVSGQDKQKAGMVWQYKVLDAFKLQGYQGANSPEEGLNKLGSEGWELVAIEPGIPRPGSVTANEKDVAKPVYFARPPYFYLKRQKQ